MIQYTKAALLALVLVSSVSFAEGRIDSISKSEKRGPGTFVVPNLELGVAEVFEIPEVTKDMKLAKEHKLSYDKVDSIVENALKTIAIPKNKVGEIPLAKAGSRVLKSTPACGWWGWRRGWGAWGWGAGWAACGMGGVCGTFVNTAVVSVGVVYGFGFGGGCGWGGGCGFFW
jgi:hypothetical protein